MKLTSLWLGIAAVAVSASPATAGMRVRVSSSTVGAYGTVLITAEDTAPMSDGPGTDCTVTLTMADPRDERRSYRMAAAGPGRWEARYNPSTTGRHTGTVVVERGEDREIGLVPVIQVKPSANRGFVRSVARGGRMFECSAGGLFPMGVDLLNDGSAPDWGRQFRLLRRQAVNYARLEVACSPAEVEGEAWRGVPISPEWRATDEALIAAQEAGVFIQLRLTTPPGGEAGAAVYESCLQKAAGRWAAFSCLAAWEVDASVSDRAPGGLSAAIAALRRADPYHHLVTVEARPGVAGESIPVDFRSAPRYGSPSASSVAGGICVFPQPVQPEPRDLWAALCSQGIGLPLVAYRLGEEPVACFNDLPRLAEMARVIPWSAQPQVTLVAAGALAPAVRWASYGQAVVVQVSGETGKEAGGRAREVQLMGAPRRGFLRIFGPTGEKIASREVTADSGSVKLELGQDSLPGTTAVLVPVHDIHAAALRPRKSRGARRHR